MSTERPPKRKMERQPGIPWTKAVVIAVESLKVRFSRSLITAASIFLATAFLAFIMCNHEILSELILLDSPDVDFLLQKRGIDREAVESGFESRKNWIIASSFLVCLVGISNALLMSVTERIKEIGTMKCLGALDSFVVTLFMLEALLLGTASALSGSLSGAAACLISNAVGFGFGPLLSIPLMGLVYSTAFSCAVGIVLSALAAIYPSLVAARMQPVEAMRTEV